MTWRVAALLLVAAAAGCGFQLRTWDLTSALETLRIDAGPGVDLHRDIARALHSAGVRVVDGDADLILKLAHQRQRQRNITVTGLARAAELELTLEVEFSIAARAGTPLAAARLLQSERVARLEGDNIAGASEEQALLVNELRADLVGHIMRALKALARAPRPASPREPRMDSHAAQG